MHVAPSGRHTVRLDRADVLLQRLRERFLAVDFGGAYPLPQVVAAYRLDDVQREQIEQLCAAVAEFLQMALMQARGDVGRIAASAAGKYSAMLKPLLRLRGHGDGPFLARIDCVWDGRRFWICEINTDAVGGIEDSFYLRQVYAPFLPEAVSHDRIPRADREIAQELLSRWPGKGLIVYTDAVCRNAARRLADAFAHHGCEAEVAHLNDVPDEVPCSWLWRHMLLTDLEVEDEEGGVPAPTHDAVLRFLRVCGKEAPPVLSPLCDRLLFDKRLLVEQVARRLVTDEVWQRVAAWIPTTRLVTEATCRGPVVPESQVLKPAHGFGGAGIRFPGDLLPTESEWSQDDWICQELVDGERIEAYGAETTSFRTVHGLHLFEGRFVGDHLRLGSGWLARGSGGYVPVY